MTSTSPISAVFLDRDGTINIESGYIRDIDKLLLIPGAAQAIKQLNNAGVVTVLTTNQSGVARGFYGEDHIHALHDRLSMLLKEEAGAKLDLILYCPHHPRGAVEAYKQDCHCRKPEIGMIEEAQKQFPQINLAQSYVFGDKASDVELAVKAGCQSILLKTGYGKKVLKGTYQVLNHKPDHVFNDIFQAVSQLLQKSPV